MPAYRLSGIILLPLLMMMVVSCAQPPAKKDSPRSGTFTLKSIAKTDIDSVLDIHIREMRAYLRELMVKLYKRNPRELHKSRISNIDTSLERLFNRKHDWKFDELDHKKGVDAIYLAFDENFQGDRVFAFMTGLTSMIMSAYGDKDEFFILDKVDPQKLYNSARNIEIAVWKLGHERDSNGELFIYSNSLPGETLNLSYERLFGKMIATQDNIAIVIAGTTNRVIKTVIQRMATAVFLPI